jgi:hypothetical protein
VAQNNGLERTSAVYGKRASVRSPLNPVFGGRTCQSKGEEAV